MRLTSSGLLAVTGALHIAVSAVAVRGELWGAVRDGVVASVDETNVLRMGLLWSLSFGLAMIAMAATYRAWEQRGEPLPASFAAWLTVLGLMVVVPLPASGGWLLFPQAGLILSRAARRVPRAVQHELHDWLGSADHVDVKSVNSDVPLRAFTARLLGYQPAWVTALYGVRSVFVRLLGMKQEGIPRAPTYTSQTLPVTPGDLAGFFRVHRASDTAWSCAVDDTHLWAGLAVVREGAQLHVVTVVRYKNWAGPIYFNVIRPFHHLVVRAMIGAASKAG
jgi:hypothetical protein